MGLCGATAETIVARNFARMVAAGTSAHSDHARGVAKLFIEVANGRTQGYQIKDVAKLRRVAKDWDVAVTEGEGDEAKNRPAADIAKELGPKVLSTFGQQEGEVQLTYRAGAHSTADDPSRYRPADDWQRFPLGDPVERLARHLVGLGAWSDEEHERVRKELDAEVSAALKEAESYGGTLIDQHVPPIESMFEDVYQDMPAHLHEQLRQARIEWAQHLANPRREGQA